MSRRHRLGALTLAASLPLGLGACAEDGVVELNWVFVDREGEPFFPGGQFAFNRYDSSCGLRGALGATTIRFDLRVELQICDPECQSGCDDPACQVVPPHPFSCRAARASNFSVPAASTPYLFGVRALIERDDGVTCTDLPPACLAVPGPRERLVEPGLVTDLQVYQVGVDLDGSVNPGSDAAQLDLEACGCGTSP